MLRSSFFMLAVVGLLVVSTAGCGGSDTTDQDKGGDQNGTAGLDKEAAADKLVGKWELDTEAFREAMQAEMAKKADKEQPGMAAMMEGMIEQMKLSMEFQEDGKLVVSASMMGQDKKDEGIWEVVSVEGNNIMLRMTDGKEKDETNKVTLADDDTLELYPPEGQAAPGMEKVVLKRVK